MLCFEEGLVSGMAAVLIVGLSKGLVLSSAAVLIIELSTGVIFAALVDSLGSGISQKHYWMHLSKAIFDQQYKEFRVKRFL